MALRQVGETETMQEKVYSTVVTRNADCQAASHGIPVYMT